MYESREGRGGEGRGEESDSIQSAGSLLALGICVTVYIVRSYALLAHLFPPAIYTPPPIYTALSMPLVPTALYTSSPPALPQVAAAGSSKSYG